ncbi:unnamed protein product [marine sediment metagenome]|uniref:Uncharacterized protein n=1 Tax=marine sediment metagenome TaxID=412755 RepID=X1VT12_9ZZZZ
MTKSCLVIDDLNIDLILNELKGIPELEKKIEIRNFYRVLYLYINNIYTNKRIIINKEDKEI